MKKTIVDIKEKIKTAYFDYCEREFGEEAEFTNIIGVGYTSLDDDEIYSIQVEFNVEAQKEIITVDGNGLTAVQIKEFDHESMLINLEEASFEDMVSSENHQIEVEDLNLFSRFYQLSPTPVMEEVINTITAEMDYFIIFKKIEDNAEL